MLDEVSNSQPLAPTACALDLPLRLALDRLAASGFRAVQLSATYAELRPRELDGSARRGLLATINRLGLHLAGLDAFIPLEHWSDTAKVDRAFTAMCDIIALAADLGRVSLSVLLPRFPPRSEQDTAAQSEAESRAAIDAVFERANRDGVVIVDHALPPPTQVPAVFGLDCAAAIASRLDPAALVHQHRPRSIRLTDLMRSGVRGPLGDRLEGQLDVLNLKIALSLSGCAGPIIIDTRQWRDPWTSLLRTAQLWNETATI